MKMTIDIPAKLLREAIKHTGAKTNAEAVAIAVEEFNRSERLTKLNARVRGNFRDFMTQADLKKLRETDMSKRD
jgi:Bacterial antitoxin of type II TA system, VapB